MDCKTGQIIDPAFMNDLRGQVSGDFQPIPDEFEEEAREVLGGKPSAYADMSQDTPLTRWAKKQRCKRSRSFGHKRALRKMAVASRKANRR